MELYLPILILGIILFGLLLLTVSLCIYLKITFKQSYAWGLSTLILGFPALIFTFLHWKKSRVAFFYGLAGKILLFIGIYLTIKYGFIDLEQLTSGFSEIIK